MAQKRVKRKIVLTTPCQEDELSNALADWSKEQSVDDSPLQSSHAEEEAIPASNHFNGEIFEQYYNSLEDNQTERRLAALANEPFNATSAKVNLNSTERLDRDRQLQDDAEVLAHQIFKLAQTNRETDIELYLSAFNVILNDLSCQEAKAVLDHANSFFVEHYEDIIRDRGERPEIVAQVVKRTGKQTVTKFKAIIKGLDVPETAKTLWKLFCSPDPEKDHKALEILGKCTEKQIRAVRQAFAEIPYQIVTAEIHDCLSKPVFQNNKEDDLENWFLDTTATEVEKPSAIPLDRPVERLRYILQGRNIEEINAIAIHYYNEYGREGQDPHNALSEGLKGALSSEDAALIMPLLAGFSPIETAKQINSTIFPAGKHVAPRDQHTYSVYQDVHIEKSLRQRFAKRALLRDSISLVDRVLNSNEEIEELLTGLTANQIQLVNQQLRSQFGYEIDPELFPNTLVTDVRAKAFQLLETLQTAKTARELFRSISCLTPQQSDDLNTALRVMSGSNLEELLRKRLNYLYGRELPKDIENTLDNRLSGNSRWPLQIDLLNVFSLQEKQQKEKPSTWSSTWLPEDQTEQLAIQIAELVEDPDNDLAGKQTKLLQILSGLSFAKISALERAFYEMTEPQQPLLHFFKVHLSHEFVECLELIFAGYNLEEDAQKILKSVAALFNMRNYPANGLKLLEQFYQQTTGRDLESDITRKLSAAELSNELLDLLTILYSPQAFECAKLLDQFSPQQPEMLEQLKNIFNKKGIPAFALERSYDYRYGRLRLHLKYLLTKEVLSREAFAETIMILENIPPQLPRQIYQLIQENDVLSLLKVLGEHRDSQPVIEETYNLLFSDKSLRKAVMSMSINIDLISETLLHLEGYYPHDVANEIVEISHNYHGDELADVIIEILSESTPERPNHRIPKDLNWIDEMTHQIRLAFESQTGKQLIATLRNKAVSKQKLETIALKVFSEEPAQSAFAIYSLLNADQNKTSAMELAASSDSTEEEPITFEQIINKLTVRGPRFRDRVIEVYDNCYGESTKHLGLLHDIAKHLKDDLLKNRLLELFQTKKLEQKQAETVTASIKEKEEASSPQPSNQTTTPSSKFRIAQSHNKKKRKGTQKK